MIRVNPGQNPLGILKRLEREADPIRRRMLEEVGFHIAVEATGQIEPAIARLAPQCEYVLYNHAAQPITISGKDSIRAHFYEALFDRMNPRLEWDIVNCMVDERAVITEGKQKSLLYGRVLQAEGIEGVDPDGLYMQKARHLVVWPFDDQVRLIGETVYFGFSQPLAEVATQKIEEDEIGVYEGPITEPGSEPLHFNESIAA